MEFVGALQMLATVPLSLRFDINSDTYVSLGWYLGPLGHLLGRLWDLLGASWGVFGVYWELLGVSWGPLGRP